MIAYNGGVGIDANGGARRNSFRTRSSATRNAVSNYDGTTNNGLRRPFWPSHPQTGSTGTLSGTFTGSPNTSYVVQIFSNPTKPSPRQEQGKTFVQDGAGQYRRFGAWHFLAD